MKHIFLPAVREYDFLIGARVMRYPERAVLRVRVRLPAVTLQPHCVRSVDNRVSTNRLKEHFYPQIHHWGGNSVLFHIQNAPQRHIFVQLCAFLGLRGYVVAGVHKGVRPNCNLVSQSPRHMPKERIVVQRAVRRANKGKTHPFVV